MCLARRMLSEFSDQVLETVLSQNSEVESLSSKLNTAMNVLSHLMSEHASHMAIYSASRVDKAVQVYLRLFHIRNESKYRYYPFRARF